MFKKLFNIFKSTTEEKKPQDNKYDKYKNLMPTVKFDSTLVTPEIQKFIKEQVKNTPGIDKKYKKKISEAFIQGEKDGNNLGLMMKALEDINIEKKQAGVILHTIHNKAHTLIKLQRQQRLGLTEAKWRSSSVPCFFLTINHSEENIRRSKTHQEANGKRFRLDTGLLIDGVYQYPGYEYGCRCLWEVIIPGFND